MLVHRHSFHVITVDRDLPHRPSRRFQRALEELGGTEALADLLDSDVSKGLPADDDLELRAAEFGRNWMPVPDPKTWVQLFIDSFDDTTLIILIVSAVVSLAVSCFSLMRYRVLLRPMNFLVFVPTLTPIHRLSYNISSPWRSSRAYMICVPEIEQI